MGSPSVQSMMQGSNYAAMHTQQHGGLMDLFEDASGQPMKGGMAPVGAPTVELQGDLRNTARIGPLDAKYAEIAGMQDGGRRRRRGRKGSRKSRKGSKKSRKSRKGSRKSRRANRKAHRKSQRRRRGGAAPLNGDMDLSSSYGDASGPKMLLNDYSAAGLNPDWKNVSSYVPKA